MKNFTRTDLQFSLCGLNCLLCPMYLGNYCPGCGGGEGNQTCRIARCSLEHGKPEYCSQCPKFPCGTYEKIDAYDSFITHRNQKRDLQKCGNIGTEAYQAELKEKARILHILLEQYNDGKKKSFFCLAVNLLELEDLQAALEQMETKRGTETLPMKEKALGMTKLLRQAAEERGISLKLRKKPSGCVQDNEKAGK